MWGLFTDKNELVYVSESYDTLVQKRKDLEVLAERAIAFNLDQDKRREIAYDEYVAQRKALKAPSELKKLNDEFALKVEKFTKHDKNHIYNTLIIKGIIKI